MTFEIGLVLTITVVIGRHLLPGHREADLVEHYPVREYLSEIKVLPNSPLVGKTLVESRFGEDYDLTIVGMVRHDLTWMDIYRCEHIQVNLSITYFILMALVLASISLKERICNDPCNGSGLCHFNWGLDSFCA